MRKRIVLPLLLIGTLTLFYAQASALTAPKWIILNNQVQFTVKNQTKNPAEVEIRQADWRFNEKGQVEAGNYGTLSYSLPFDFYPQEFTLAPGEEKQIIVELHQNSLPERAQSSLLVVEEIGVDQEKLKVGFAKYVRIFRFPAKHNRKWEAYITEVKQKDENTFEVDVKNKGNMPIRTVKKDEERLMSYIKIQNSSGQVVKKNPISTFALLPGQTQTIEVEAELEPGYYNLLAIIDYGGENRIGGQAQFEIK